MMVYVAGSATRIDSLKSRAELLFLEASQKNKFNGGKNESYTR